MSADCEIMAGVANSWYLRFSLIYSLLSSILCTPCALYCVYRIWKSSRLHFNTKSVFMSHTVAVIIHCVSRSILHFTDLYFYFSAWASACQILPTENRCLFRKPYKYTQFMVETSTIFLTVERVVATISNKSYEHRLQWIGFILILAHNILALSFVEILSIGNDTSQISYYCAVSNAAFNIQKIIPDIIIFTLQSFTFYISIKMIRMNERYQKQFQITHSLSQRYQIKENLRTIATFKVTCLITAIYVLSSGLASIISNILFLDASLAVKYGNVELIQCIPTYYIILIYVFFKVDNKYLPSKVFQIVRHQPENHFSGLQKHFDDAFFHKRKM
ncbi:unnamed protein product [Caenorhabditis angaria]|uniref:G-protein coupled receptors family 1 profile domain-containing protein n=1 Tax=Caenorhabditis angaria TaxID=860376 RepID=A0A9P1N4Y4_9PELO|nr:unnamed protein product [Caenorhabditis angaria]